MKALLPKYTGRNIKYLIICCSWHLPVRRCSQVDRSSLRTDRVLFVGCLVMIGPPSNKPATGALYYIHVMSQHIWLIRSGGAWTCRFTFCCLADVKLNISNTVWTQFMKNRNILSETEIITVGGQSAALCNCNNGYVYSMATSLGMPVQRKHLTSKSHGLQTWHAEV